MTLLDALVLGVLEGVTEFLPVSSTGHLTIAEKLLGYSIDDPGVTAFTAIIQVGAVVATLLFFRRDIVRLVAAFLGGLRSSRSRRDPSYRLAWGVVVGSIPIGVAGLLFQNVIETTLRSLWVVGAALLLWSAVMFWADSRATQRRGEAQVTWRDTLAIGVVQCLALVPGVSRSGATMSIGLLLGLDRLTVTRLSFFLSIPALTAAGALQGIASAGAIGASVGWPATLLATLVSFLVAYITVAWLLRFIARHTYRVFVVYRVVLGLALLALLGTGAITAT